MQLQLVALAKVKSSPWSVFQNASCCEIVTGAGAGALLPFFMASALEEMLHKE